MTNSNNQLKAKQPGKESNMLNQVQNIDIKWFRWFGHLAIGKLRPVQTCFGV